MITRKPIRRLPYVTGVTLLPAMVSSAGAKADTIDFNFTGSIVSFTAPVTGVYDIDAFDAQGGVNAGIGGQRSPGLGAEASGQFNLTAARRFRSWSAARAETAAALTAAGGGGGGSFVSLSGVPSLPFRDCSSPHGLVCPELPDTLLVAAGGGGGAGTLFDGVGGQSGTSGVVAGFLLGTGGGAGRAGGVNSLLGFTISTGASGGFGGGWAGGAGAGGGGGGSSGGGGSYHDSSLLLSDEMLAGGVRGGSGEVIITFQPTVAVSEPASLALLGTGLIALAALLRRWKKA